MKLLAGFICAIVFFNAQKAMDFKELQKFFPNNIEEYTFDMKENGGSFNQTGMSFSFAEKNYIKNNAHALTLKVIDYKTAHSVFQSSTMMWNSQFKVETNEVSIGPYQYKDFKGWKTVQHNEKKIVLLLAAYDRYLITIDLSNSTDIKDIEKIIKQFNYSTLEK